MSDILQGNKLQIINGVPIIWDLDGRQRCTNAYLFFKNGYKVSEFRNGTVNRVVMESIMATNYLDKWNKLEDMCQYIKEHGSLFVFEDMVERMEEAASSGGRNLPVPCIAKKINGISFGTIIEETKATKDKGIVTKKINHLEALLKGYLSAEMKAAS